MKRSTLLLALGASSALLQGAEQSTKGPMDSHWFYDKNNPYNEANELHQERDWKSAEDTYTQLLVGEAGDEYDQANARVNLAACSWAQNKPHRGWDGLDTVLGIPKELQISKEKIKNAKNEEKKSILIRTDKIGIGDIFHFVKAGDELKKRTGWDVIISIPNFLKSPLSGATTQYGLKVVGARDEQPTTTYTTHLVALLGHLKMDPASVIPEKPLYTPTARAINAVNHQIKPILAQDKKIGVVFLGENRQATLIGGKQLPRDTKNHGRHLDSKPFMELLKNHPELILMDCGTPASRLTVDEDKKDRCMQLAAEEEPFDTIIALAFAMSMNKKIIALGADNGPTNVFARALNQDAQRRMAFIIPGECDMRTEGSGAVYKQSISHCPIYRCQTPADQTQVIENAYNNMTNGNDEDMIFRVINPDFMK